MTQTAMTRGFARWAAKNMAKEFAAGSLTRIGLDAFTRIADASPALALQMALAKYPSFAPIVSTVKDAETFGVAWKALVEAVEQNGFLPFEMSETFGRIRTFKVRKGDLDAMREEMERAYKDELAAAKAIEAAGQANAREEGK